MPVFQQFYEGAPWRFVITDLDSAVLTFLDRLAADRTVTYTLNKPTAHQGVVPSNSPEINILHTDGDPFLSGGNRRVYRFRGQPVGTSNVLRWVPKFGGTLLQPNDTAATEVAKTRYTAFDPWQTLYSRPVLNGSGLFPGPTGLVFPNTPANDIVVALLTNTDVANGTCRIDYGQTEFYAGTIETCDEISMIFQQGAMVGEAWDQIVLTQTCDIVLTAIFDPINRPGFVAELNIYQQAGSQKDAAIFAWDLPSRSLSGLDRLQDYAQLADKIRFFTGQGVPTDTQTDAAAVAKYGQWWAVQQRSEDVPLAVELLAAAELQLRRQGKKTVTINPVPERSPIPFEEYFVGDTCPTYASRQNFRELLAEPHRVYVMPVVIADNSIERVDQLLLAKDAT